MDVDDISNEESQEMEVDEPPETPFVGQDLCVVCTDGNNLKDLSDTLAKNLASNLSAFNEHNLLLEEKDLNVHLTETLQAKGKDDLETSLKRHSYQIHIQCI